MSEKYKARNNEEIYFVTFTITGWVDVFIRNEYRNIFLESLRYCQSNKGLEVYAYVIMTSHVHMITGSKEGYKLSGIIRDLKKFTSKKIVEEIQKTNESRKEWLLKKFAYEVHRTNRGEDFKFWQDGYHPIELTDHKIAMQKLEYIHMNPVQSGFVDNPEDYLYSSARNYCGMKGLMEVEYLN